MLEPHMNAAIAAQRIAHASLSPQELEFFLSAIEASARIRKRFQFYLWSQGALQSFIPHETLICSLGQPGSSQARCEISTRHVLSDACTQALCCSEDSLLNRLSRRWIQGGCQPMRLRASDPDSDRVLGEYAIHSAFFHGTLTPSGNSGNKPQTGSFFAFLQDSEQASTRTAYLLELLLPHLHMALNQMLCAESTETRPMASPSRVTSLSEREAEILGWIRAGKTNFEIGMILGISPLTVKNHVQKILRKLNVSNRAQAAAWASKHGDNPDAGL